MRKQTWNILSAAAVVAGAVASAGAVFAGAGAVLAGASLLRKSRQKGSGKLFPAPGTAAVRVLQFLVPKKAYDEVFAQVIADTREEYFAALDEGDKAKAVFIRVRDSINLWMVFLQYLIIVCLDRGMKVYKAFDSK